MAYRRKIDPYVFMERLLSTLERQGYRIMRSARYSGDGGIDGRFIYEGKLVLVQSRRYTKHIQMGHVKDFVDVVQGTRKATSGVFVHTGRTGKGACRVRRLVSSAARHCWPGCTGMQCR